MSECVKRHCEHWSEGISTTETDVFVYPPMSFDGLTQCTMDRFPLLTPLMLHYFALQGTSMTIPLMVNAIITQGKKEQYFLI